MPLLSGITSFLDKYVLGYAIGTAAGPSLEPFVQDLANDAWRLNPKKPVDAITAAAIVAENVEQLAWGADQAVQTGIDGANFDAILGEAFSAPGIGELFQLWRRGLIGDGEFVHGLRKAKLELRWDGPLQGLKDTLLSSEELAMLQQQGFVSEARADAEGLLQGVTSERQQLRFEASGLPPGWAEGLAMLRRGIIDEGTFGQIVREGHTKTKYTPELLALRAQILSVAEATEARLKGWLTKAEADAIGVQNGYTAEQMQVLYDAAGRPAAPGQMATAVARGIDGPDGQPMDEAQFLEGIRQSNIHPRWGPMLWGIRYAYPPLFQINRLVQQGAVTPAEALVWAKKDRYAPEVLTALAQFWQAGQSGAAKAETKAELLDEYAGGFISETQLRDALAKLGYTGAALGLEVHLADARRVKKWREKAIDAIGKAYVEHDIDDATALADLAAEGITDQAASLLLNQWQLEQRFTRKHLTAAQIKRAYRKGILTVDQATTALEAQGYSAGDAGVYLAE